ncbi:MAG: ABC transporter ATP-binding protein [Paracoccaceae bacterium]
MLAVEGIGVAYGHAPVLRDVSFSVGSGEIVCLLGRNGAGKTTAMKATMGLLPLSAGRVVLAGQVVSDLPAYQVPRRGIGYVPQGRRLFGELTVAENLAVGMLARQSPPRALARALELFPRLHERMGQRADTLSGGEQQMLAMARALCVMPKVILLDEPTEGLQPSMVAAIRDVAVRLKADGVAVLLVEQRTEAVLALADRVVFLENGRVTETVGAAELRADPGLLRLRLGL